MRATVRPLLAEFLGTFAFVFIGAGSIIIDARTGGGMGLIGVALAHGIGIGVWVTAVMRISGAHLNPAVTLALWMSKHIEARMALQYVAAQLVAAVLAALTLKLLFPAAPALAVDLGVPRIAAGVDLTRAIFIEALLTFTLVSAVYGTAVSREAPAVGGFGIGLAVFVGALVGGSLTGAAMNPARAFGPAVAAAAWHGHVAYWIGPALGAALAAFLWSKVLLPIETVRS